MTVNLSRRHLLASAGALGATSLPHLSLVAQEEMASLAPLTAPIRAPEDLAKDEDHWRQVAAYYPTKEGLLNLENGYFGVMPLPVLAEYQARTADVNTANSYYARAEFYADYRAYRTRAAEELGVGSQEITFTRGATEALQNLIANYNKLKPGDAVMYADLDFGAMQDTMDWLQERRGVDVVRFAIPEPATKDAVLSTYEQMLNDNPKVRLLLLTHVSNRTGLHIPVAEIAALARARDVDIILDSAHSFGQIDFKIPDLDVDFIGLNFHKWMGGPLGAGLIYIKQDRLQDIDPAFGNSSFPKESILSRVSSGTSNFAAFNMIPAALDFYQTLGPKHKEARLKHLRNHWVAGVEDLDGLEILTPNEPDMISAMSGFRLKGQGSKEQNKAVVDRLLSEYNISTVWRDGVAKGDCVRVTPNIYTMTSDMDRFVIALREIVQS